MTHPPVKRLGTVTVTYQPDIETLCRQLECLPNESPKIIVDNGSDPESIRLLRKKIKAYPGTMLLTNRENLGLATASNQGVRFLRQHYPRIELVLLLDQDSLPDPGSIETLLAAHDSLTACGFQVGAVGPQLRDADTGLMHGFHQMTRWRWIRRFPPPTQHQPLSLVNLNGSGTLMRVTLYEQLGGLAEDFFIDHVDTEWSFRLLHAGYGLWGIPNAVFTHRMGKRSLKFWFLGWRVWPWRSPQRHRYLFRNTLRLLKRPYVPKVWKVWALIKLSLTAFVHGVFDTERCGQLTAMVRGIREGVSPYNSSP